MFDLVPGDSLACVELYGEPVESELSDHLVELLCDSFGSAYYDLLVLEDLLPGHGGQLLAGLRSCLREGPLPAWLRSWQLPCRAYGTGS